MKSLFINGQWIEGNGEEFYSLNPATLKKIWSYPAADKKDAYNAIQLAKRAFTPWAQMPYEQRKNLVEKFAKRLKSKENDFASAISEETGKPLWESKTEVTAMINKASISIEAHENRCGIKKEDVGSAVSIRRFKPHGVVVVLGPFNLPGHLPNGHIIPALLAGNTIVFKPSEQTPLVGQKIVELWESVGLPPGVLNLIQGGKSTGVGLLEHPDIDGVYFTGSARTGREIHQAFGGHPEKILALEMGGNNPLIVHNVSDIDAAVYTTIQSAFITSGQRCVCARRLILVGRKESEKFVQRLVEVTEKIRVGPYTDSPEPFMGPVINVDMAAFLVQEQEFLANKGCDILVKMEPVGENISMLKPGVIDVTQSKERKDEELFGPLLQIIYVNNFDEAIKEANNTAYGLAAGLLCDDEKLYQKFFALARAGVVNWNMPLTGASSRAPFGGVGISGNHHPSAYFAADYCSYPIASMESKCVALPQKLTPGIELS